MDRNSFYDNLNKYKQKDELMHYGTLGQKWGVRKWQNYDGTFNEAGKERYFGKSSKPKTTEEEKVGSNKSNVKDYLKFRNKMLKQRTRSDLNQWYRDKMKDADKQLIKDAKRVDKQQIKMYKNQLKDFYDNPEELVNDLDRMYRIGSSAKKVTKDAIKNNDYNELKELNEKIGAMEKKSDNPENKYQNEDGTLTKKGYKKFAMTGSSFWSDDVRDDLIKSWAKDTAEKKIDIEKYKDAEYKHRANIMNDLLNDDSLNVKDTLKSQIYNKTARKNMTKMLEWCKENGIKEVTPEMMEGNRVGNKYLAQSKYINNDRELGYSYAERVLRLGQIVDVQSDRNVKKFLDNNKTYKEYNDIIKEQKEKYNEICNIKLRELVEKELGVELPHTVINKKTGALALNLTNYVNDEKVMNAVKNNMKASIEYGHENKEIKALNEKGYKTLQKCEKEATEFAKDYLNSTAEYKIPGSVVVNTKTGDVGENDLASSFAYDMLCDLFEPYER